MLECLENDSIPKFMENTCILVTIIDTFIFFSAFKICLSWFLLKYIKIMNPHVMRFEKRNINKTFYLQMAISAFLKPDLQ